MNKLISHFSILLIGILIGSVAGVAQPIPQYELTIQNPQLIGSIYQFDIAVKRLGSVPFRLGNCQFILTFNAPQFSSPAIDRIIGSEEIGSAFFFDQVIVGGRIMISLGGNGSYVDATDISAAGTGTRVSTYQVSGVNAPVLSPGFMWVNPPELIRTGLSEIDAGNNYRDITDETGASHSNGGGEFAKLSGYKFNDLDGNGLWDRLHEPPLSGWQITLIGPGGQSTVTSGSGTWQAGYYEFVNIPSGTYSVTESVEPGWSPTVSPVNPFTLSPGQQAEEFNFGNFNGPTFRGILFEDLNGNGTQDPGESGIAGWQIVANKVGGGTKTAITNGGGEYVFAFQPTETGTWVVNEAPLAGWIHTVPALPPTYTFDVQSGSYEVGKNFGVFEGSSISGLKFVDVIGDGSDIGDPPFAGWKIILSKNGNRVDSVLTDGSGIYVFDSLTTGNYTVQEEVRGGWIQTTPVSGGAYIVPVTAGGTVITGKNFGNFQLGSVSGMVYYDLNHNGSYDAEQGMTGIVVEANGPSGVITTTSLPGGSWEFTGLTAGIYSITEHVPSGYHLTEPSGGNYVVTIQSGSAFADHRFGNSAAADTQMFRSLQYDSIALMRDLKGRPGIGAKAAPDKVQFCIELINGSGQPANGLHLRLGPRVVTNDPSYPFVVTPTPASITFRVGANTLVDIVWSTSIPMAENVTVCGWGNKPRTEAGSYYWLPLERGVYRQIRLSQFSLNVLRWPMPNAANVSEEVFRLGGFGSPPTGGLCVGIPKPENPRSFGWVKMKKIADLRKSFRDRSGVHTISDGGLDYFDGVPRRLFIREQRILPPTKQNNRIFANLATLKINIAASALGILPREFGNLIYDDGVDPLSGRTLLQIAGRVDSALTIWGDERVELYARYAEVLEKINDAFAGAIDTSSFALGLVLKGTRRLQDVPFLRANPLAVPYTLTPPREPSQDAPISYALRQNYPNPFNPTTTIEFALPQPALVTLEVFNVLGQNVATLLNHQWMDAGTEEVEFEGGSLASGVYFCKLTAEAVANEDDGQTGITFVDVRKMMLMK